MKLISNILENNYKIIQKTIIKTKVDSEISLLNSFFGKFPSTDVMYQIENDTLTVYLNSIDIKQLKEETEVLIQKHKGKYFVELINDIKNEIEKIGSYGVKGNKRVFVGYNNERKVLNRKSKEENREQFFYAHHNNFSKLNNNLSKQFENKIIQGDSAEVLKQLPDNSIDLIFTSPPYNFGLDYQSNEDAHHWDSYFTKLFEIFNECIRVVKFGGRILVNIQPLFSDYIPSHHIISNFFMQNKMIWKGEILWEKNNYNCKYTAWGSWKSPSNPYLKYTWEFIEIFSKGMLKKEGKSENIDINADEFKKWVVAKWSIAPERKMKHYNHPAMFPEELAVRVIKLFSFKEDIVLDPFNGVGTTTTIAKRLNRRYLGIDISKEYCEIAENRLNHII